MLVIPTATIPTQPYLALGRLKATKRMSGTLRVTRVPYEEGDAKYDQAVALFDDYSGSYPICGEFTVSDGRLFLRIC